MRIEKINEEKIYTFNLEMNVDEIWELYCILDTHPYVEVAERLQTVLDQVVPELAKFKNEDASCEQCNQKLEVSSPSSSHTAMCSTE